MASGPLQILTALLLMAGQSLCHLPQQLEVPGRRGKRRVGHRDQLALSPPLGLTLVRVLCEGMSVRGRLNSIIALSMLVFGKLRLHVTLHKQEYGSNFLHFVSACSGKSQLSNYATANYLKISIWTWLMSYHVKTTLCHDIMTYDKSW